jgi:hypothetical protein
MDGIVRGMKPFRDWPFRSIDYIFVRFGAHGSNALDIVKCERMRGRLIKCNTT